MASYPITPSSLDVLDPTTPSGLEDPSKLDDSIRQLKAILVAVLEKEHNADGTHKGTPTVGIDAGSITGDKISSSTTEDIKRAISTDHIKDLAIITAKLADLAVTAAKIANATITQAKMANNSIGTAQIIDGNVTASKLDAACVDNGNIIDGIITQAKLADGILDTPKYIDNSVTPAKVGGGTDGRLLGFGPAGIGVNAVVGGDLTMTMVAGIATFKINSSLSGAPVALIEERGTQGGGTTAATWVDRPGAGATSVYSEVSDAQDIVGVAGVTITIKKVGTYLMWAKTAANATGITTARLRDITNAQDLCVATPVVVPAGSQQALHFIGGFSTVVVNVATKLQVYAANTVANTGLGVGGGAAGVNDVLTTIFLVKVA